MNRGFPTQALSSVTETEEQQKIEVICKKLSILCGIDPEQRGVVSNIGGLIFPKEHESLREALGQLSKDKLSEIVNTIKDNPLKMVYPKLIEGNATSHSSGEQENKRSTTTQSLHLDSKDHQKESSSKNISAADFLNAFFPKLKFDQSSCQTLLVAMAQLYLGAPCEAHGRSPLQRFLEYSEVREQIELNEMGMSALFATVACKYTTNSQFRLPTAKVLLAAGACVNAVVDKKEYVYNGHSVLMLAAARGDKEMVQMLCEQPSINVNFQAKNGFTALMRAVYRGHAAVASLLLQQGADVTIKNPYTQETVIDMMLDEKFGDGFLSLQDDDKAEPLNAEERQVRIKEFNGFFQQLSLTTYLAEKYEQTWKIPLKEVIDSFLNSGGIYAYDLLARRLEFARLSEHQIVWQQISKVKQKQYAGWTIREKLFLSLAHRFGVGVNKDFKKSLTICEEILGATPVTVTRTTFGSQSLDSESDDQKTHSEEKNSRETKDTKQHLNSQSDLGLTHFQFGKFLCEGGQTVMPDFEKGRKHLEIASTEGIFLATGTLGDHLWETHRQEAIALYRSIKETSCGNTFSRLGFVAEEENESAIVFRCHLKAASLGSPISCAILVKICAAYNPEQAQHLAKLLISTHERTLAAKIPGLAMIYVEIVGRGQGEENLAQAVELLKESITTDIDRPYLNNLMQEVRRISVTSMMSLVTSKLKEADPNAHHVVSIYLTLGLLINQYPPAPPRVNLNNPLQNLLNDVGVLLPTITNSFLAQKTAVMQRFHGYLQTHMDTLCELTAETPLAEIHLQSNEASEEKDEKMTVTKETLKTKREQKWSSISAYLNLAFFKDSGKTTAATPGPTEIVVAYLNPDSSLKLGPGW